MDSKFYKAVKVTDIDNGVDPLTELWRFVSNKSGRKYNVHVEHYAYHLYTVKFYDRSQKNNPKRYGLMTNDGEPLTIINSVIQIMKQYANGDQRSSFLFFGSPAESEGAVCTKRFRVYRMLMMRYFSGSIFYHYPQADNSMYLMLRRTEEDAGVITPEMVGDYVSKNYIM